MQYSPILKRNAVLIYITARKNLENMLMCHLRKKTGTKGHRVHMPTTVKVRNRQIQSQRPTGDAGRWGREKRGVVLRGHRVSF